MDFVRILSVDPSLTCSGWALFDIIREALLGVGKIRALGPKVSLNLRLKDLQTRVTELLDGLQFGAEDILVCEAQTTMRDPKAAIKVEQVRGIFETVARDRGVFVPGRVNPRTIHNEIMGLRGRQLARPIVKDTAVRLVEVQFRSQLAALGFPSDGGQLRKHQDIVDAILIGTFSVARIRHAVSAGFPLEELFEQRKQGMHTRRMVV